LKRHGYEPIVYDNLQTGHREAVRNDSLVLADLADAEILKETLRSHSVDSVMHFAADSLVGESVQDPKKYFNNNVRNSLQLIEILSELKISKFIFSSSAAVYGEPETVPILERHPCLPTNPYGETKWIFEKILEAFHALGKINYISLRYFNAAGADPGGDLGEDHAAETHLIPLVLRAALDNTSVRIFGTDYDTPDGTCIRDYIHVTDLAEAHILALKALMDEKSSGVYNLGNGNGYSVKEVLKTAENVTGKKIKSDEAARRPGDPARLVASSDKMQRELGWIPKYPQLTTIIQTAWEWHRAHPKGYRQG
jgi:UDP-glucose 4-epimerase